MTEIAFTSQKNYLKHALIGSSTMNKPNIADGIYYGSSTTINHNLGYRPLVRAWYDPNNDGTIAPVRGMEKSDGIAGTQFPWWFWIQSITETSVVFKAQSFSSESGTFTYYYKIYLDTV